MRFRKALLRAGVGLLTLGLLFLGFDRLTDSTTTQVFGTIIARVETPDPVVALTFDDGPSATHTGEVLKILAERDIPATFFVLGRNVGANPDAVQAIIAAGHELGNHSWDHRAMWLRSARDLRDELARTDAAIRDAGYTGPLHFRPPFGRKFVMLPWVLSQQNRPNIMWSVAAESFTPGQTADEIHQRTVSATGPGDIILLHPMYGSGAATREALPRILDDLTARGLRFVLLSDLLARRSAD